MSTLTKLPAPAATIYDWDCPNCIARNRRTAFRCRGCDEARPDYFAPLLDPKIGSTKAVETQDRDLQLARVLEPNEDAQREWLHHSINGASDQAIVITLRSVLGLQESGVWESGACSTEGPVCWRSDTKPAIWFGEDTPPRRAPDLSGKTLIHRVRLLFQIGRGAASPARSFNPEPESSQATAACGSGDMAVASECSGSVLNEGRLTTHHSPLTTHQPPRGAGQRGKRSPKARPGVPAEGHPSSRSVAAQHPTAERPPVDADAPDDWYDHGPDCAVSQAQLDAAEAINSCGTLPHTIRGLAAVGGGTPATHHSPLGLTGLLGRVSIDGLLRLLWREPWQESCEIVADYMPPFPTADTQPRVIVKCGELFLRHSAGPLQGYFWDCYGDDMQSIELAVLAVSRAPSPFRSGIPCPVVR